VAGRIRTTWGRDQDIYAREARTADAMITYRFPHQTLERDAPNLKLLQILGAGVDYLLPLDTVVADKFAEDANTQVVTAGHVPKGWQGLDIGPETITKWKWALDRAKMVVWNGPAGVFEMDKFAEGTKAIAEILANSDAVTIIGGGDTAAAVNKFGVADKMTHVSTGGGASLEMLEGKVLPGVAALTDKK
jgi:phosphoglycerate kinase